MTGVASLAATLATVTAAVFAVGAYNASWQAVGAARDQANSAKEQLAQASQTTRPYLILNKISVSHTYNTSQNPPRFSYVFSYEFKNYGTTPAIVEFVSDDIDSAGNIEGFDQGYKNWITGGGVQSAGENSVVLTPDVVTPTYVRERQVSDAVYFHTLPPQQAGNLPDHGRKQYIFFRRADYLQ